MNNSIERKILLLKAETVIAELAEAVCPGILLNAALSLEARTTGIVDDSFLSQQFDSFHEELQIIQYHLCIEIELKRIKKLIKELTLDLPQNPIFVTLLSIQSRMCYHQNLKEICTLSNNPDRASYHTMFLSDLSKFDINETFQKVHPQINIRTYLGIYDNCFPAYNLYREKFIAKDPKLLSDLIQAINEYKLDINEIEAPF